jgi:hypothetical protein
MAEHLAKCATIRDISVVGGYGLTSRFVATLAKTLPLRCLRLSGADLTDSAALSLQKCPQLQCVNLSDCELISDRTLKRLAKCRDLRRVDFTDCNRLTASAVKHLLKFPRLRTVAPMSLRDQFLKEKESFEKLSLCEDDDYSNLLCDVSSVSSFDAEEDRDDLFGVPDNFFDAEDLAPRVLRAPLDDFFVES